MAGPFGPWLHQHAHATCQGIKDLSYDSPAGQIVVGFDEEQNLMLIAIDQLADIIGADESQTEQQLPGIDPMVWKLAGTKADAIYGDAGNGWCALLHIIPKAESLEVVVRAIIAANGGPFR